MKQVLVSEELLRQALMLANAVDRPDSRGSWKPTGRQLNSLRDALREALEQPQEPKCNTHPKAPHGFDRNASHSAHRYVCDCESWEPYQAGYDAGFKAGMKAEQALCDLAENTQALEQPAQEPVARRDDGKRGNIAWLFGPQIPNGTLLFTAPQARTSVDVQQWPQLLTDEEIAQAWACGEHNASAVTKRRVSRAIQQAVLKKNGVMK